MPRRRIAKLAALALPLAALALQGCTKPVAVNRMTHASEAYTLPAEQEAFWASLEALCGLAFEGQIAEDSTRSDAFAGQRMVMHVMTCERGRILVPFHVGENRSRTWVFTREPGGIRLKHDHRHEDGSEEDLTQYGGDTENLGTATTQEFHADAHTAEMLPPAATNIWTVEIIPGRMYAYALRREGTDRRFRVEFDLTRPITPPPLPWGHE